MGLRKKMKKLAEPVKKHQIMKKYQSSAPGSVDWLVGAELNMEA